MRIVFISDTHEMHSGLEIPEADLLIHAGDISMLGTVEAVSKFNMWLSHLPVKHKVVIAGNHDFILQKMPGKALITEAHYLEDSYIEIEGLKIYGSPWTPKYGNWAFMKNTSVAMLQVWSGIPEGLDILITHGPPRGILDSNIDGIPCGCPELLRAIKERPPKVMCFGHIHEARGQAIGVDTLFINASICGRPYEDMGKPVVLDLF